MGGATDYVLVRKYAHAANYDLRTCWYEGKASILPYVISNLDVWYWHINTVLEYSEFALASQRIYENWHLTLLLSKALCVDLQMART